MKTRSNESETAVRCRKSNEFIQCESPIRRTSIVITKQFLFGLVFCLLSFLQISLHAAPSHWIGPETSHLNQWTRFHRSFQLKDVPATAKARIAVDSKYWLWVNGELVVREGGLKRGPNPSASYCDEVDLASALKPGTNSLAVLVWHFGQHGFSHNSSGVSGLCFSLDLPGEDLVSDGNWKMSPHPAIRTSPDTPPNRRLPESSLLFDARQDEQEWTAADFDASTWPSPVLRGSAGSAPWGALVTRPIPQWKDYGLKDYPSLREENGVIKAKLPYNAQVNPWMEIEAAAGLEIDIRTDNFMGGSAPNVHEKYITREGVQQFECLGWMNGHEVHYRIPAGVKVRSLKFRETGFDTEFSGSFRCDDNELNTLWAKAARTLYVTMRDTYMDCPDRERAQWWGDVVNELGEVAYALDPKANCLTRKAIRELVDWRRPDASLYSPVPAGIPADGNRKDNGGRTWYSELPVQMLASIGKYGFWTYYLNTGDAETIRHAYPAVRDYLNLWKLDGDLLVTHRPGDWDWSDWGEDIDARILDSAWYQLALEGAIHMARLSGNETDISRWNDLRGKISSGFNKTFWNGSAYRSPAYKGDTDDRANALAVLAGFATPEQFPALKKVLEKHRNASPWMEKYVLEALFVMDAPELAMKRMKERYKAQIDSPLTTLWEGWGIGGEGYGGGSYNHAWSGGPLTCLSQFGAGITPTSPGFASYAILPQMGDLRRIECVVDSPKGMIRVELRQGESEFSANVRSPSGVKGVIGVPRKGETQRILSNGMDLKPERSDSRFHYLSIPQGEFSVRSEW
jgi:alpha-L-rhamnosidase